MHCIYAHTYCAIGVLHCIIDLHKNGDICWERRSVQSLLRQVLDIVLFENVKLLRSDGLSTS